MRRNTFLWKIVEILLIIVFTALMLLIAQRVSLMVRRNAEQRQATEAMLRLREEAARATPTPEPTPSPSPTPVPEMLSASKELLDQNADYVGMLGYGETAMYVCRGADNTFYASHNFEKKSDYAGMIYMDYRCCAAPLLDNTILYGHNMRDGSRFGSLRRLASADFLKKWPTVQFVGLYEVHTFAPIAVMRLSVDPKHKDYFHFDIPEFDSEAQFNKYIRNARKRSIIKLDDHGVQYGDRLLTLATCSEEYNGGRLVAICVEVTE